MLRNVEEGLADCVCDKVPTETHTVKGFKYAGKGSPH